MKRSIEHLRREWVYAIRSLRRRPGFTTVAALTLAIGIGANTSIFSVVRGVLLRPLPYADPDRIVVINTAPNLPTDVPGNMSFPDIKDIRDDGRAFESVVGYSSTNFTLTGLGDPDMLNVTRVTEGLLSTFRVAPAIGRDIRREEFGPNAALVVVLSDAMWRKRFAADRNVIGRSIQLDGVSYEIVGVAPSGFDFPAGVDVWLPRRLNPTGCGRGCHAFNAIGRLAPNVSLAGAAAELQRIAANLTSTYPETNNDKDFMARELKEFVVGDVKRGLWIMLGAVALVLLIACANVANLLIARASSREGETALRSALGATRGMLARQVFAESAALALLGGGLGIGLAFIGVKVLRLTAEGTIPRAQLIAIDPIVLLATLGSVVFVTFAFGLIPALTLSRSTLSDTLSTIGRGGSTTLRTVRFRRALLAGEVALSAALLIGAGLLLKTFTKMYAVDVGFEKQQVARFRVVLPAAAYPEIERVAQFYASLESRISELPGVEAVGSMFGAPLSNQRATATVFVQGRPDPKPENETGAAIRPMTPGLQRVLGLRLLKGRALTDADNRRDAEPVALVNEGFVRQNFPHEDPIGQRVRLSMDEGFGSPYWRIVGIVRDVRFDVLTREALADLFVPHTQYGPRSMNIHVRLAPGAPPMENTLREAVRSVDPNIPIYRYEQIEEVLSKQIAPTRLYLLLVAGFAVTAALLAAVGLYGVMSFIVAQRTREIGIRVALGAQRHGVASLVVRQGMQPVVIGLGIGVFGAALAGRFVESVLFGVQPRDPFVMAAATLLMVLVALGAAAMPALRASGIDPARVLHVE
ncbi:MAG TPA: ABC transporter permease [Gemmatimonadaceae bacterium]